MLLDHPQMGNSKELTRKLIMEHKDFNSINLVKHFFESIEGCLINFGLMTGMAQIKREWLSVL
jgi:hypothetical protein